MIGAELGFLELERLLEKRQGQVQLSGSVIRRGEVAHARERLGMIGAKFRFPELERLLEKRQGQVQLAGSLIRHGKVVHARERVGMFGAELGFLSLSVSSKSGRARSSFPAS